MGRYFYGFAINRYATSALGSCVRDLHAIRLTLERKFNFECEEYTDEEVTLKTVQGVLERIVKKRAGEDVIVFFSGHGSEKHAWCLNGQNDDEYLESQELHRFAERARTRQLLLISDSCYALGQACKRTDVQHAPALVDELERAEGKWFLAATGDYAAWDGGKGLSPFMAALIASLEEMQEPEALQSLYPRVRERCHAAHSNPGKKQVPYLRTLNPTLHGELVFRPVTRPSVLSPVPAPSLPPAMPTTMGATLAKVIARGLAPQWTEATNGTGHIVFVGKRGTHVARLRLFKAHIRAYIRERDGTWSLPSEVRTEATAREFVVRTTTAWGSSGGGLTPTPQAQAAEGEPSTAIRVWRREVSDGDYKKFLAALRVEHLAALWEAIGEDPTGVRREGLLNRMGVYAGDVAELVNVLDTTATERVANALGIEHDLIRSWRDVDVEICYMLREDSTPDWAEGPADRRVAVLTRLRKPELQAIYRALGSTWDPDQPVSSLRTELNEHFPGTIGGILRRLQYETLERLVEGLDLRVADWNRRTLEARLLKWVRG